ncbi:YciI family protein [Portibacter lacus]|nr:YciI family protein [Portibacter lacus]
MRSMIMYFGMLLISLGLNAQNDNPKYDAELAAALGADDYGMKTYVFVILKTGDNTSKDEEKRNTSFAGHMKNISQLVKEDKLVIAGPMLKNDKNYRGIFILNVDNLEAAEDLLATDPAIKDGYIAYEMYPWYGSAAISEYLEASDKVWKIKP